MNIKFIKQTQYKLKQTQRKIYPSEIVTVTSNGTTHHVYLSIKTYIQQIYSKRAQYPQLRIFLCMTTLT